jgi:hypothetical protein
VRSPELLSTATELLSADAAAIQSPPEQQLLPSAITDATTMDATAAAAAADATTRLRIGLHPHRGRDRHLVRTLQIRQVYTQRV